MEHELQIKQPAADIDTIKHYNPVEVRETIGLTLMSILAFALLIALLQSEARNRALVRELFRKNHTIA
jgi:hypothetical protein